MSKWDWVAKTGAFGEIPVKILQNERAEFLLDVEEDITIDSYDITSGEQVVPGDVCIFKAEIIDATQSNNRFLIEIEVNRVEFVRKIEGGDREIQEMMDHLDTAKAVQSEKRRKNTCDNCREIDNSTRLSVETNHGSRDLHYCSQCRRLLTTREFETWKANNH